MTAPLSQPQTITDWHGVLDEMQVLLGQLIQQCPEPPPPAACPAVLTSLPSLDNRLAEVDACLSRAEENAGEADRHLAAAAAQLQQWLNQLAQIRKRQPGQGS